LLLPRDSYKEKLAVNPIPSTSTLPIEERWKDFQTPGRPNCLTPAIPDTKKLPPLSPSYAQTSITPLNTGYEARVPQPPPPALHPLRLHRPHGLCPQHPGGFVRPPGIMRHVHLPGALDPLQSLCLFRSLPTLPRFRSPWIRRPEKPPCQTLARQPSPPRRPRYHLHQFLHLPLLQRADPLRGQEASPDVMEAVR